MEQFDQLLTCAICLDRYRNPKLLPCQHSFCMEPCLEGLVDYVRRQIKCPECRAEHRVGYQGVSAFPTNVTLTRFLELHIDLTGELPDPFSNQVMERCQICSEKSYCSVCAHCDKKICGDCKDAHVDVLKREIQRITNQVKRVLGRLEDAVCTVEKNSIHLQTNSMSVIEEIDDIYRRLSKALKDRAEYLKHEVERYLGNEIKQLSTFRSNLEQEVANIQSNCELVEKYMVNENGTPMTWQDNELMDAKDIFLKTMEFIRNFEYEPGDYARRIKFSMTQDPNTLSMTLGTFGDLHLPPVSQPQTLGQANTNNQPGHGGSQLTPGQGSALMRSKSDHRLTTQFRNMPDEDDSCGSSSYGSGRKFGEPRPIRTYGQDDESGGDRKSRFRSRFTRHLESSFEEPEPQQGSRVRFEAPPKERERVLDTDDVSKGPMSGIARLSDSPLVIQRIAETERPKKPSPVPIPTPQQAPVVVGKVTTTSGPAAPWRTTSRQLSEDDEIAKQKKQNKADQEKAVAGGTRRQTSNEPKSPGYTESSTEHPVEVPSQTATQQQEGTQSRVRKLSPDRFPKKRSESEDSGSTSESATSSGSVGTEDVKNRFMNKTDGSSGTGGQRKDSTSSVGSSGGRSGSTSRYQNRYMSNKGDTGGKKVEPAKEEEEEESSESESTESESEEEESDSSPPAPPVVAPKKTPVEVSKPPSKMDKTDIGPLLARSANARDHRDGSSSTNTTSSANLSSPSSYTPRSRRVSDEPTPPAPTASSTSSALSNYRRNRASSPPSRDTDPSPASSRYGSGTTTTSSSTSGVGSSRYPSSYTSSSNSDYTPGGLSRSRTGTSLYSSPTTDDSSSSRYSSGLASKYLNRSRHNFDVDDHPTPSSTASRYGSSTSSASASSAPLTRRSYLSKNTTNGNTENESSKSSRLTSLKDRRAKVNRSKSSHDVLAGIDFSKDDDEEGPESPGKAPYNSSSANSGSSSNYARRKSTVGTADSEYKVPSTDESTSLSSWARYLKNKYGKDRQQPAASQRSPVEELPKFNFSTNSYMNKKRLLFKFGSRGSDPGFFTWPRGIASGPDGQIVVADSSNHRIQVFLPDGTFVKEFGQYGNMDGEFDCLAGIAVNRIGQFIVSDRYNHRIQVFDPSGRFLRSFGSQGSTDGKFNYPWGLATDSLGFIYVCDKENHRIQVFQSDGTFVGKFGSMGSKIGELEHPHYIAVTSTNKVIVTDTNNHRISIWDVNGRVLSTIGSEGSEDGQFKMPRGLAVDESGVIIVGDSGNNRIVILSPEGTFLRSFGSWGSGDGEFKGMEGVAVTPNGNILVCDRENHRVQVF